MTLLEKRLQTPVFSDRWPLYNTMHIVDFLTKDLILTELKATTKNEVISEFAQAIAQARPTLNKEVISNILLEREKLGSTGIQDGIAIPHGKLDTLPGILVAFGRSKRGIDFQAHDAQATYLFFVLLAPESATGTHLKILARLSRLLKGTDLRTQLINAKDAETIYQVLLHEDEKF